MINKSPKKILLTGAAGFIGSAVAIRLLKEGEIVIGLDNLNSYYDINLKKARLKEIEKIKSRNWSFYKSNLHDKDALRKIFNKHSPEIIINLAAQAGVRYSLENPYTYIESNILGFTNLLEFAKNFNVENFLYASSSSVYGGNINLPYSEEQSVDHPISLYAATKKSNEVIAHSYSHLYALSVTGLRLFTVYGPWGRPDMAPMIFAKSILENEPIKIFNHGEMKRDFTFIDDVVDSIFKCCYKKANSDKTFNKKDPNPSTSFAPFRIFNVGNSNPTNLKTFIEILENKLQKKAIKEYLPMQPGDVKETAANTNNLDSWIGPKQFTNIEEGIEIFAKWFKYYYQYE